MSRIFPIIVMFCFVLFLSVMAPIAYRRLLEVETEQTRSVVTEKRTNDPSFLYLRDLFPSLMEISGANGCQSCHKKVPAPSSHHDIDCGNCHNGDEKATGMIRAHLTLVQSPGSFENLDQTCGKCHKDISSSLTIFNLENRHRSDETIKTVEFRVCKSCHLGADRISPHGSKKNGCVVCHMIEQSKSDGVTMSFHRFTKKVPSFKCMECHYFHENSYTFLDREEGPGFTLRSGTLVEDPADDPHLASGHDCGTCHGPAHHRPDPGSPTCSSCHGKADGRQQSDKWSSLVKELYHDIHRDGLTCSLCHYRNVQYARVNAGKTATIGIGSGVAEISMMVEEKTGNYTGYHPLFVGSDKLFILKDRPCAVKRSRVVFNCLQCHGPTERNTDVQSPDHEPVMILKRLKLDRKQLFDLIGEHEITRFLPNGFRLLSATDTAKLSLDRATFRRVYQRNLPRLRRYYDEMIDKWYGGNGGKILSK